MTTCGLTGLAFVAGNVIKIQNFYKFTDLERASCSQAHVKTV